MEPFHAHQQYLGSRSSCDGFPGVIRHFLIRIRASREHAETGRQFTVGQGNPGICGNGGYGTDPRNHFEMYVCFTQRKAFFSTTSENIRIPSFEPDHFGFVDKQLIQDLLGHGVGIRLLAAKNDFRIRFGVLKQFGVCQSIINDAIGLRYQSGAFNRDQPFVSRSGSHQVNSAFIHRHGANLSSYPGEMQCIDAFSFAFHAEFIIMTPEFPSQPSVAGVCMRSSGSQYA
jgi:hypothetical protein